MRLHTYVPRLAYALSDLYKQQGNDDIMLLHQAIDYFTKSIEILNDSCPDPTANDTDKASPPPGSPEAKKVDALYGRALCYIHLKKWSDASTDLNRITKIDREYAPAYFYLGETRRQLGIQLY